MALPTGGVSAIVLVRAYSLMVERRIPNPSAEVRFLVGPLDSLNYCTKFSP
jgi:hypothetical protein